MFTLEVLSPVFMLLPLPSVENGERSRNSCPGGATLLVTHRCAQVAGRGYKN